MEKDFQKMTAIETQSLSKTFSGDVKALTEVSFAIAEGAVFGFLGPNGSGKTTCIRVLNGILSADSGNILINEKPLTEHGIQVHSLCGVMTENAALYENLTGQENLTFFGQMQLMDETLIRERSDYLLHYLGLDEAASRKAKTYSSGMKKKLSLAIALLHNPGILYLDEPTASLDPESAKDVLELISRLAKEENKSVFLCSHQLRYIETICNLYGFLNSGNLIAYGTFEQLLKKSTLDEKLDVRYAAKNQTETNINEYVVHNDSEAAAIISSIISEGNEIFEARRIIPQLEDLYFTFQNSVKDDNI